MVAQVRVQPRRARALRADDEKVGEVFERKPAVTDFHILELLPDRFVDHTPVNNGKWRPAPVGSLRRRRYAA